MAATLEKFPLQNPTSIEKTTKKSYLASSIKKQK